MNMRLGTYDNHPDRKRRRLERKEREWNGEPLYATLSFVLDKRGIVSIFAIVLHTESSAMIISLYCI